MPGAVPRELRPSRSEVVVLAGVVAQYGGGERRVVGLRIGPGDDAVAGHDGPDGVRSLRGQNQGQPTSHAEPDDTDVGGPALTDHLVHGAAHVTGRRSILSAIISLAASSGSATVSPW